MFHIIDIEIPSPSILMHNIPNSGEKYKELATPRVCFAETIQNEIHDPKDETGEDLKTMLNGFESILKQITVDCRS